MSGNPPTAPPALRGRPSTYRYHNPNSRQTSTSLPPPARASSQELGPNEDKEHLVTTTQTQGSTSQHQEQGFVILTKSDQPIGPVSENSAESTQRMLPFNFYITRDSGARVPLIAVDELPPRYQIVGAPRILPSNVEQSHGLIYAGHVSHRDRFHEVRDTGNIRREPRGPKFPGRQKGGRSSRRASNPIRQPHGPPSGPPSLPQKVSGAPYTVHPLPPNSATGGPSPRHFAARNVLHSAHPLPPMRGFQPKNALPVSRSHNPPHPPYLQPSRPSGPYGTPAEHTIPTYQPFPEQPLPPPGSLPIQRGALTRYMQSPPLPIPNQYGALPNYMGPSPPSRPMSNANDQNRTPDQYIPSPLQPQPSHLGDPLPLGYPNVYPWSNSTSDGFGGR